MALLRLNIGAGDKPLDGWTNIDRSTGGEAVPLPYADGTVDEIRASHILEHFSHREVSGVIAEWRRVLKPGGRLRIAVPDFDKIVQAHEQGSNWPVQEYVMGGHLDGNDRHGCVFNRQFLIEHMQHHGFAGYHLWKSEIEDCAALPVSLNIGSYKVDPASWKPKAVQAMLSHPRLAHTECMFTAVAALTSLGIPLDRGGGVFWNQAMQGMMEQAVARGMKYILTLDYDAVFVAEDIVMLYDYMERHPEVSAICPMQVGRDRDTVLLTVDDEHGRMKSQVPIGEVHEQEVMPIRSGHFACALIRVADLARLPRPWLCHKPDREGGWDEAKGRIDDDTWFWSLMKDHGMRVVSHNRVSIGHVQVMVTWPDMYLRPIHQYQRKYHTEGKPMEALC